MPPRSLNPRYAPELGILVADVIVSGLATWLSGLTGNMKVLISNPSRDHKPVSFGDT